MQWVQMVVVLQISVSERERERERQTDRQSRQTDSTHSFCVRPPAVGSKGCGPTISVSLSSSASLLVPARGSEST